MIARPVRQNERDRVDSATRDPRTGPPCLCGLLRIGGAFEPFPGIRWPGSSPRSIRVARSDRAAGEVRSEEIQAALPKERRGFLLQKRWFRSGEVELSTAADQDR